MDIIHGRVSSISAEDQVTNADAITVSGLMEIVSHVCGTENHTKQIYIKLDSFTSLLEENISTSLFGLSEITG
jgi:hypothetical protein